MASSAPVRIGTRASALARWQAEWVGARIQELHIEVELVPIITSGDRQQQGPIGKIGSQGVFTREIQNALLEDRIDLAVHSLKDLPTDEVSGLCLAAVPRRASVCDVLVCREHTSLHTLAEGSVLGTGSLRRRSQLLHERRDLRTMDIRGNVETRLRKLDAGDYDAVVLAEAGLRRLGLQDRITQVLPMSVILPAIGQGALGLESRREDQAVRSVVEQINDPPSHAAVAAERAMLSALQGGCLAPIAAWGRVENRSFTLDGRVLSADGAQRIEATLTGDSDAPEQLGRRVAEILIEQGAIELIRAARGPA